MRSQLLCTFTDRKFIIDAIQNIRSSYVIDNNKIFIYELVGTNGQCICSYNILDTKINKFLEYTISVHRKKDFNVFYTINALNTLIIEINNGILDTNFSIDWINYKDMLILINDNILNKQKLKFKEVFYFKTPEIDYE